MVIENFGSIFTQLRPGQRPQEFVFLKKKRGKGSKSQCPGLNCVKINPNIFKKKNMLHTVSQTGCPQKNKKYDTSGVLFTGFSGFSKKRYSGPVWVLEPSVIT